MSRETQRLREAYEGTRFPTQPKDSKRKRPERESVGLAEGSNGRWAQRPIPLEGVPLPARHTAHTSETPAYSHRSINALDYPSTSRSGQTSTHADQPYPTPEIWERDRTRDSRDSQTSGVMPKGATQHFGLARQDLPPTPWEQAPSAWSDIRGPAPPAIPVHRASHPQDPARSQDYALTSRFSLPSLDHSRSSPAILPRQDRMTLPPLHSRPGSPRLIGIADLLSPEGSSGSRKPSFSESLARPNSQSIRERKQSPDGYKNSYWNPTTTAQTVVPPVQPVSTIVSPAGLSFLRCRRSLVHLMT
jgi:hypothetical protein